MFTKYANKQHEAYLEAMDYYKNNPDRLIEAERFVMNEILHFIDIHQPEIKRDYDEASYLYSFWKNYPPEDRGRAPKATNIHGLKLANKYLETNCKDISTPTSP